MKTCAIPKSAKATSYHYLSDTGALYFDATVYETNTTSFIRISVNDGPYYKFKIDVNSQYFEGRFIELLNAEFNLIIPQRNRYSSESYQHVIQYCINSIAEHFELVDFSINNVDF